jgi:hypothetical protein
MSDVCEGLQKYVTTNERLFSPAVSCQAGLCDPIDVGRRHYVEASMSKANEWDLLKRQFDALTHDDSVGCVESIDEIFDVQFRRRFTELINQTAQHNSTTIGYNWPRL